MASTTASVLLASCKDFAAARVCLDVCAGSLIASAPTDAWIGADGSVSAKDGISCGAVDISVGALVARKEVEVGRGLTVFRKSLSEVAVLAELSCNWVAEFQLCLLSIGSG
jgi:hypothetical protein